MTPIERHGDVWLKRDDLYEFAGVRGGKVRTCEALARRARTRGCRGLVTAGSRHSPQVNIVAHVARALGMESRLHVPKGELGPELLSALAAGGEVIQHKPGYNSVIVKRARDDAAATGWYEVPFGMECATAVAQTASQVPARFPDGVQRLVVPVGSGMSLAGVLAGLRMRQIRLPVLGVVCGADPRKRLAKYGPVYFHLDLELERASVPYECSVNAKVGDVALDPNYEAKCVEFLKPGDLFWVVGRREYLR